jgi:hypothetical protein
MTSINYIKRLVTFELLGKAKILTQAHGSKNGKSKLAISEHIF